MARLPEGTITFMLTDLQGSTRQPNQHNMNGARVWCSRRESNPEPWD
jgi:hypothetical protein